MKRRREPIGDLLRIFAGPIIWFAHFVVLYGAATLMCASPGVSAQPVTWIAAAATALALGGIGFVIARERGAFASEAAGAKQPAAFLPAAAVLLALISGGAAIWTALPVVILPGCFAPAG